MKSTSGTCRGRATGSGLSAGLFLCLLISAPATAARLAGGGPFILGAEERLLGDLYFAGPILRVDGQLSGSAVAACQASEVAGQVGRNLYVASQNVDIAGSVSGDVLAVCVTLNVGGAIGGALRAGCGTAHVSGRVRQDLVIGCQNLILGSTSEIDGDVIAACSNLEIDGTVHGTVRAAAGVVVISGQIDGDVELLVGDRIVLSDDARIYGDLRYRAEHELDVGNRDAVYGDISYTPRLAAEQVGIGRRSIISEMTWPVALYSLVAALVITVVLLAVWKSALRSALETCLGRFGYTLGFGALGLFAGPVAVVVGLALVVTVPAAGILGVSYLFAVYLAKILAGMLLGRAVVRLCRRPEVSLWVSAPAGVVIIYGLCAIPVVRWFFWLLAVIAGFGVLVELIAQTRRPLTGRNGAQQQTGVQVRNQNCRAGRTDPTRQSD